MITLLLARHGTTWANEEGKWLGWSESSLSIKGRQEVLELKEKLKEWCIEGVYTSPSQRTIDTVLGVMGNNTHYEVVEALREIDFGQFEGKTFQWAQSTYPEEVQKMVEAKEAYRYPGGECLEELHQRVAGWLKVFLKEHTKGTYLICAHGGSIRCLLSEMIAGSSQLHWRFKIQSAALTVVTISEGYAVIEALNT